MDARDARDAQDAHGGASDAQGRAAGDLRSMVAAIIDHTLLTPEATAADVRALVAEARELRVGAVCVSPSMLPLPAELLRPASSSPTVPLPDGTLLPDAGSSAPADPPHPGDPLQPADPLQPVEQLRVAAVCGFPSGKHHSLVKAAEARFAVESGADEIDMVIDIGAAVAGDDGAVLADIIAVREAIGTGVGLKVILETAVLGDDAIVQCCLAAERAGADYVKTSTGFHPAGGATEHAVRLMAQTVGGRLGIKASGGIRTAEDAILMIEAGATRLGLSGSRAVLDGLPEG